jgi:hypothetical protein
MALSLSELIDYYMKTALQRQSKKNRQDALATFQEYQRFIDQEFYEQLDDNNLITTIKKYDSNVSKGKEVNIIQNDLVQFVINGRSDESKRQRLQCILKFWIYLYEKKQIPVNPVGVTLERGEKNIDSLVLHLIPESTALRQVELLKLIQDPKNPRTKEELSDLLFVSTRTIEGDFKAINEHHDFWQYSRFNRIRSWDSQTGAWEHESNSTAEENYTYSLHPFFTVLPLDAIAGLLQGIEVLRKENYPHLLAFDWLTSQLCAQLSPYAKERLESLDFELTPANGNPVYVSEMEYNAEKIYRPLSHAFKSGDVIDVSWIEDGKTHSEKVRVKKYPHSDTVILEVEGKSIEVTIQNITEVKTLYPYRSRQGQVLRQYIPPENKKSK